MLHTCPGHIRDEVHRVTMVQRLVRHICPVVQSVVALHSTQRPDAVLHTCPRALQSRSETHGMGATSERSATSLGASAPESGGGDTVVPEQLSRVRPAARNCAFTNVLIKEVCMC